jgi:hypothetical protein
MKFMVILKGDEYCELGSLSDPLLTEMARYNRALVKAGVLVTAEELHPSARGARVERSHGKRRVVRGPFAEPGGEIAGFWILNVASLRDAVEWVERCPLAKRTDSRFVIRQLYDFGDFGAEHMQHIDHRNEPLIAA